MLQVTLDESAFLPPKSEDAVIELDEALEKLAGFDARAAKAVELMFFGGHSYDSAGEVPGVSKTTIFSDIKLAKAWLAMKNGRCKHGVRRARCNGGVR